MLGDGLSFGFLPFPFFKSGIIVLWIIHIDLPKFAKKQPNGSRLPAGGWDETTPL
jgi:hypothetical protein